MKRFAIIFVLTMTCIIHCAGQVAISMGTSVLWADRNVGAHEITECGSYFSWSETEEKSSYIAETMKYWTPNEDFLGCYLKYVLMNQAKKLWGLMMGNHA